MSANFACSLPPSAVVVQDARGCVPRLTELRSHLPRATVAPLFTFSITSVRPGHRLEDSESETTIVSKSVVPPQTYEPNRCCVVCIVRNPSKERVINKYPNRTINCRESWVRSRTVRVSVWEACCDHTLSPDEAEGYSRMC